MTRQWALSLCAMLGIVALTAVVIVVSPGPVEAHLTGLVPPARKAPTVAGRFSVTAVDGSLRFHLAPDALAWVGVVAVDGTNVSPQAPLEGRLTRIDAKSERVIDGPPEAPGMRFIAAFCTRSMTIERLVEATRAALARGEVDELHLDLPCTVTSAQKSPAN